MQCLKCTALVLSESMKEIASHSKKQPPNLYVTCSQYKSLLSRLSKFSLSILGIVKATLGIVN